MKALSSPPFSRAPMGGDHAFRIPKTNEIFFTALGFFLKSFDLCAFFFFILSYFFIFFFFFFLFFFFFFFVCVFVSYWSCFCESTHYEKKKKNNIKITTIYKPVEQTHYCAKVFLKIIT